MSEPIVLHGDAIGTMHDTIAGGSIDLIYSDPPFGTQSVWKGRGGTFADLWRWSSETDRHAADVSDLMPLITAIQPERDLRAYLVFVGRLLRECRRVLKPTGTIWLHFDDTMGAHIRVIADAVFGPANTLGTMIWRRADAHNNTSRRWGRVHDTVGIWQRSRVARWRLWRIARDLPDPRAPAADEGARGVSGDPADPSCPVHFEGFFATAPMSPTDAQRTDYPTQKPVALLEEIIAAATLPGDTVLDPTCGSGTTLVAARKLRRVAVGIDASEAAVALARRRASGERLHRGRDVKPMDFGLFEHRQP